MRTNTLQLKKALLATLLFLLLGMAGMKNAMAQVFSSQQSTQLLSQEATIEFDITEIATFEERVFFLHNLLDDSRFNIINDEADGVFVVSSDVSFEELDLMDAFDNFCEQNAQKFAELDKFDVSEIVQLYKADLPEAFFQSLMMDVYVRSRQNNLCANADMLCMEDGLTVFPASVNSGNGESGPNYSCLSVAINPAWFYLQIGNPGPINIHMYSTPSYDLDFCCWGPFTDPISPCPFGLTGDKVVSCSYSANATENCIIPSNAQTGEYYILVITNYSNNACNITLSKNGGAGTTSCGPYNISVSASPEEGGTITGDGVCYVGQWTVSASANAGYAFMYWTEDGEIVSTDAYYSFVPSSDRNLIAHFALPFNIIASASPEEGGIVSGGGAFDYGTTCTLTATANEGYTFMYWIEDGEVVSNEAVYSFMVTGERVLTAHFALPFTVSATADPAEGGTVSEGGSFEYGMFCTFTATANEGYTFMYWTENGEVVSDDAIYSFMVESDRILVAHFALPFTVSAIADPLEGGTVSEGGIYEYGMLCTLSATANEGYTFMYWTENGEVVSSESTYSFTVVDDRTLVAHFALPFTISAMAVPENGGTVSGMGEYVFGTVCTLTATPIEGYAFVNWTEDNEVVSTDIIYSFNVDGNRTLEAHFALIMTILVSANPEEGGMVECSNSIYGNDYKRNVNLGSLVNGCNVVIAARHNETTNSYLAVKSLFSDYFLATTEFNSIVSGEDEILPVEIMQNKDSYYWTVNATTNGYTFTNAEGQVLSYYSGTFGFNFVESNTGWLFTQATSGPNTMVPNYLGFFISNVPYSNRAFAINTDHLCGAYNTDYMSLPEYNFFFDLFVREQNVNNFVCGSTVILTATPTSHVL